ncbi:putative capsid triplex subunit 1 [Cyprinid herpesvirus 1]|uniref:Putative capsid triplex subunit 1 n=1 Tax=Cyprinid herpesvirus 1 TaxID=317858 RepID=K7PBX0_9VIRU|nr:putative capsid triplex subunit 1 [Cyprinid herpesvirus 1]AFJ20363.1 putative capsid triplex subunit 1 [Cyprinid herpesvirus 1]
MASLMNATKDGLNLGGYDHEIIHVPLWCCTSTDRVEHFEAYMRCNLSALDQVCRLDDFRCLIKNSLDARDVSCVTQAGGGVVCAGAPLFSFMQRWNKAVDSIRAKLELMTPLQLAADYTHMITLSASQGSLFNESDADLLTEAIAFCVRDGEDFGRLFSFYGVTTYQSFHAYEKSKFSYDQSRQFNLVRRGTTNLELSRLNLSTRMHNVSNPYIVLATVPVRVGRKGTKGHHGSLTKLELFYWSESMQALQAHVGGDCHGHTGFENSVRKEPELRRQWYRSSTLKLNPNSYVGAFFLIGKQITLNPFSLQEIYRAPHVNILGTGCWHLVERHNLVESQDMEGKFSTMLDDEDEEEEESAPVSQLFPTNEDLIITDGLEGYVPAQFVDPRVSQYHDFDEMLL